MSIYEAKLDTASTINEIIGYEGMAAREYFTALSKLIRTDFKFNGRTRRPPKDAFNSMISLGYTIIFYEIYAEIASKSLSPYIGYIHRLKERYPALVSDLLEEWRAVIIDSTVMSIIQGNEISIDEFYRDEESGGVVLSDNAVKILVKKLEQKMRKDIKYLTYLDHAVSFRRAIWWQTRTLATCIDNGSFDGYSPIRIR